MLLYQNMILRESGKKRDALKHLQDFSKFITDKIQVKELQGGNMIVFTKFLESIFPAPVCTDMQRHSQS